MLYSNLISLITIATVHLGFAALLGVLIRRNRAITITAREISILIVTFVLFIGASLSLSLSPTAKGLIWLSSVMVIIIFGWLFNLNGQYRHWGWHYAGFTMSVILLWSLFQTQPLLAFSLGLSAGIAAILSLRKGFRADPRNRF